MVAFSRLAFGIGLIGCAVAVPRPLAARDSTSRVRTLANGVQFTSYSPPGKYETFGDGIDHPLSKRDGNADVEDVSVSFVSSRLNSTKDDIFFRKSYSSGNVTYTYMSQKINGIEVANAVANLALNSAGKVVAFGTSFVEPVHVSSTEPKVSSDQAISAAEQHFNATHNDFPTSLKFLVKDDGSAVLTHVVQVQNDRWLQVYVDAATGEVVTAYDFTADSAFLVIPIDKQGLNDGQQLIQNPEDLAASPNGWNSLLATAGNNAFSCKGQPCHLTAESDTNLIFNYPADDSQQPEVPSNVDAARTNVFYVVNSVHDITYRYGFTERAGNFQSNNFNNGGLGDDAVEAFVQEAGVNNANFATPPDGQPGIMRLFPFDRTFPRRDSSLQNDIIAHEYTHGVSNRLTGGGSATCLQSLESGGMGEGWSDAFSDWLSQTAEIRDFTTGSYVLNNPDGGRSVPYSTNRAIDPLTYSDLQVRREVHDIGEVWATMLHDVHADLINAHGFSEDARTNPDGDGGNVVFMHLFIDQLALQPCEPTFVDARNAWIQADINGYGGANFCLLWNAFAGRGLGLNAGPDYQDNFDVPPGC